MNTSSFLENNKRVVPIVYSDIGKQKEAFEGARQNNGEEGFTLLEVLVALAIISGSFAILLGAVNKSLSLAFQSKNLSVASTLAQSKLVELELEGYPSVGERRGTFKEYPEFDWNLSISPYNIKSLGVDIRLVLLTISWDKGNKELKVATAMSNYK